VLNKNEKINGFFLDENNGQNKKHHSHVLGRNFPGICYRGNRFAFDQFPGLLDYNGFSQAKPIN
jgi:hypothetical protein